MKRSAFLALCVLAAVQAGAAANITDVAVAPDDPWRDEVFTVSATCTGADTVFVSNASQDTLKEEGVNRFNVDQQTLLFTQSGANGFLLNGTAVSEFFASRSGYYAPGRYTLSVVCGGRGSKDAKQVNFTARELDLEIRKGLNGGPFYTNEGESVKMKVFERTGGSPRPLGSSLDAEDFTVRIDGKVQNGTSPFYNTKNGWQMSVRIPSEPGTYTVSITVSHEGVKDTEQRQIVVEEPLQYSITPSTRKVAPGDTITVDVSATYRGEAVTLSKDDVQVGLGDGDDIVSVPFNVSSSAPGKATLTVRMPDRSSGSYPLRVQLDTDRVAAARSVDISYPMRISGAFRDANGAGLRFQLFFRDEGSLVKQVTGSGQYQTTLTPGTYDVEIAFPGLRGTTIEMTGVSVDGWSNPVTFRHYQDSGAIPGFALGGLYAVRTSLDPDETTLTLAYSTAVVANPRSLRVYHCSGWNVERATCYGTWEQVPATFDRVARTVTVEDAQEGAYAVAARDALHVQYAVDRSTYTPDQRITVSGVVQDGDGATVAGANVTVDIPAASTTKTTITDAEGIFEVTVPAPDRARNYTATIRAEKDPYRPDDEYFYATVERPARMKVVAPDQVRLAPNETRELTVYLQNTGYRVLDDVTPRLENVSYLQRVRLDGRPLQVNETREATLILHAPRDAAAGTRKATLRFAYAGKTASTPIGITVTAPAAQRGTTISGMVAGTASALSLDHVVSMASGGGLQSLVLLLIGLQIAVVAVILVRRRSSTDAARREVTAAFDAVKDQVDAAAGRGATRQQAVAQQPGPASNSGGETRDRVMHAVSQIKQEIQQQ